MEKRRCFTAERSVALQHECSIRRWRSEPPRRQLAILEQFICRWPAKERTRGEHSDEWEQQKVHYILGPVCKPKDNEQYTNAVLP